MILMSKEHYNAFLERVQSDQELQQKLASQDLNLISVAKDLGFEITQEDFVTAEREEYENESTEIGLKELADVAGGTSLKPSSSKFTYSLMKLPGLKLDGVAAPGGISYWGPVCNSTFNTGANVSNPNPTSFM